MASLRRILFRGHQCSFQIRLLSSSPKRYRTKPINNERVGLWEKYASLKASTEALEPAPDVDSKAVFANNETLLGEVEVYGFDYDYTLANYTEELHGLIYDLGVEALISKQKYPKELRSVPYNPDFAVRGLHYDVQKGILMKIDAFHSIQLGTVYKGLNPVSNEEVMSLYHGTHVPVENMNTFHGTGKHMHQLMDLFALPEMTLLSNVIQYFINNNILYDPEYVFYDVRGAVQGIHLSGVLHNAIASNLDLYLGGGPEVAQMLKRLVKAGKKIFLITNSGFEFVNSGMTHMVGPDWVQLFDVIIASARKPKFFNESSRPFRIYDRESKVKAFSRVDKFEKGQIYLEGNLNHFRQLTNWFGSKVLYFGDHVYSDLADPSLKHGWQTGAIIPELENEIKVLNSGTFKESVRWLLALQELIEEMQIHEDPESQAILKQWLHERDELRITLKQIFNPQFGSLFRTYHNPTYFSRRLSRFADLYTSSVNNLMQYGVNHTFYPRRAALPHEVNQTLLRI